MLYYFFSLPQKLGQYSTTERGREKEREVYVYTLHIFDECIYKCVDACIPVYMYIYVHKSMMNE